MSRVPRKAEIQKSLSDRYRSEPGKVHIFLLAQVSFRLKVSYSCIYKKKTFSQDTRF